MFEDIQNPASVSRPRRYSRSLAAGVAAILGVAVSASVSHADTTTLYDAPRQQDGFLQPTSDGMRDAAPFGIPTTTAAFDKSEKTPFWAGHEIIRLSAEDTN